MKRLLLATAVLILAGCSDDDPETQLASCKVEAMRVWPNEDASASLRRREGEGNRPFGIVTNHIDEYVTNCMRAKGYHLTLGPADCVPEFRFPMQAACYETTQSWFEKQLNRIKKWGGA